MSSRIVAALLCGLLVAGALLAAGQFLIWLSRSPTALQAIREGFSAHGDVVLGVTVTFGTFVALGTTWITFYSGKSRSAKRTVAEGGDRAGLGSAHYPRRWLRRGQWPGADRRNLP